MGEVLGKSFTVKECTFEKAVRQGFGGTPERWEEIKENYRQAMIHNHGEGVEIDYNDILFDGQGMQDADGDWHK